MLGAGSDTAPVPRSPMSLDLWLSGLQAEGGLHLASPEHGLSVPVLLCVCISQKDSFHRRTSISHLPLGQIVFFRFIWRPRRKGPTPQIRDPELGARGTEDTTLLLSPEQCKHTPKKLKNGGLSFTAKILQSGAQLWVCCRKRLRQSSVLLDSVQLLGRSTSHRDGGYSAPG